MTLNPATTINSTDIIVLVILAIMIGFAIKLIIGFFK